MGWNCRVGGSTRLMSCWWLDSIYFLFGPVGARRDCCLFVECFVGGVPSYLYLALAWSSELFVFRCGLEFRAICISLWLGFPSYLYFAVAWISEPMFHGGGSTQSLFVYSPVGARHGWSPAEVS